eukprot:6183039-Pleurochrysis_carterae.AAC.4
MRPSDLTAACLLDFCAGDVFHRQAAACARPVYCTACRYVFSAGRFAFSQQRGEEGPPQRVDAFRRGRGRTLRGEGERE